MDAVRLVLSRPLRRTEWRFGDREAVCDGYRVRLDEPALGCLRALVAAGGSLRLDELLRAAWPAGVGEAAALRVLERLRRRLRTAFGLPAGWNPVAVESLEELHPDAEPVPSPEQIRVRAAAIRREWDEATRLMRLRPDWRPIRVEFHPQPSRPALA